MSRRLRVLVLLACVVALGACQMRVDIGVDVKEDGSGRVSVGVGLDSDAMETLGGIDTLRQLVKVDDLTATGWKVTGPAAESDGNVWVRASKPFASASEAASVLAEVAGGPFRDFALTRDRSFARTTFEFSGTVDFTAGLESFSDPELTAALDGEALGQDIAAIEEQFGGALDRLVQVRVAVRLPGAVSSNAPGKADNGAVWEPRLSEDAPVTLEATSRTWHKGTLVLVAIAGVAGFALVLFVLVIAVDRVRSRRRAA